MSVGDIQCMDWLATESAVRHLAEAVKRARDERPAKKTKTRR